MVRDIVLLFVLKDRGYRHTSKTRNNLPVCACASSDTPDRCRLIGSRFAVTQPAADVDRSGQGRSRLQASVKSALFGVPFVQEARSAVLCNRVWVTCLPT